MIVTYPLEPLLAVCAKDLMIGQNSMTPMISELQGFLAHGTVNRRFKGKLIV